jgi:hypothetical protein
MDIQTVTNLQTLIETNPNILLIEIWDKVLYLRMRVGKNVFHSKKGLTKLSSGIYLNLLNFKKDYKDAQQKFHPDRNEKHIEISKGINQWKEFLSECNKREFDRTEFNILITTLTKDAPIFSNVQSISIALEQAPRLWIGSQGFPMSTDEQRAKTARRWEKEFARRSGRNKDGSKYKDPFLGDLPF